jgi:hypothetical protein
MIVDFPYCLLVFACAKICLRSSFLLVTPDKKNVSASIVFAITLAIVVLPQPGGHRKSIEGIFFCSKKMRIGLFSPIRCFCPIHSSRVCGLSNDESGSDILDGLDRLDRLDGLDRLDRLDGLDRLGA